MDKKTIRKLVVVILVLDLLLLPPILWYVWSNTGTRGEAGVASAPPPPLQKLYALPDFTFTNQESATVSKADFAGKAWVAYVFFTTCAGPCPVMNANVAELAKDFTPESGVRFAGFTVDPQMDTPAVLKAYGERYEADFNEWFFFTGEADKLQTFARDGLKLGSGDSPLIHSEYFVLIDKEGYVRGYFTGTDTESLPQVTSALEALAAE